MASPDNGSDPVILIHGVLMPSAVMWRLGRALKRGGFSVRYFGYPSRREPLAAAAGRLAAFTRELGGARPRFVGHSMGGIVALEAAALIGTCSGKIVALGSPFRGSIVGQRLSCYPFGSRLFGPSKACWESQTRNGAPDGWKVLVLAGDNRVGVGTLLRVIGDEPSDGTVMVSETELPGAEREIVHASHTGLLFSSAVVERAAAFLR